MRDTTTITIIVSPTGSAGMFTALVNGKVIVTASREPLWRHRAGSARRGHRDQHLHRDEARRALVHHRVTGEDRHGGEADR